MRRHLVLIAASVALVASACSSSGSSASKEPGSTTTPVGATTTVAPKSEHCAAPGAAPAAVAVTGSATDFTITSFDATKLLVHWYAALGAAPGAKAATVLEGPGWGQPGSTDTGGSGLFGDLSVHSLRTAGYNVLTWDPRGFGKSTGTITTDDPLHEGRDVQTLLDWVAARPEARLDAPGDPRVGMVGGSYGGGIQFATAARDCRVDAIAPTIAWHSLVTSLFKNETVKQGWGDLLYGAAAGRSLDPHITDSHTRGDATGVIPADDVQWFASRGPGDAITDVKIPTLITQGTVDTLFTLDEAVTNFTALQKAGTPVWMLWYCGGHGACLSEPGDSQWTGKITLDFLARFLKGDQAAPVPPTFATVDQHGTVYQDDNYPAKAASTIWADGTGTLTLTEGGGAGPAVAPPGRGGIIGTVALSFQPGKATHAVNVKVPAKAAAMVLGAPELTITYTGTSPAGERPTRVFAQLVDDSDNLVLGNQVTPIPVTLDGAAHTLTIPLEMVAHSLAPGQSLTLQIAATTPAYAPPRLGGSITFSAIHVALPVVDTLHKR